MTPPEALGGTRIATPAARRTATSRFGASRREGHDASAFYARFTPPNLCDDDTVTRGPEFDPDLTERLGDGCICGDARQMAELPDACVALVVTSPPYFVASPTRTPSLLGLTTGYRRATSTTWNMLREVFAECVRCSSRAAASRSTSRIWGAALSQPFGGCGAHLRRAGPAVARRDRVAKEQRVERVVCVGVVSQPVQSDAA